MTFYNNNMLKSCKLLCIKCNAIYADKKIQSQMSAFKCSFECRVTQGPTRISKNYATYKPTTPRVKNHAIYP